MVIIKLRIRKRIFNRYKAASRIMLAGGVHHAIGGDSQM
jgi:hypothetical protein